MKPLLKPVHDKPAMEAVFITGKPLSQETKKILLTAKKNSFAFLS